MEGPTAVVWKVVGILSTRNQKALGSPVTIKVLIDDLKSTTACTSGTRGQISTLLIVSEYL